MQQIRQALKRKQSQLAKLTKEIELLQQVEEKLLEIAPLLAEGEEEEEEEGSVLVEVEDEIAQSAAAGNGADSPAPVSPTVNQPEIAKPVALRWP